MTKREVALGLLGQGFSVIPLYPKSKTAMVKWVEFQSRRATTAEVETWWASEPNANIGIVTGAISGIFVGDVDPRNGGSVEDMQRDAPAEFVVTTPGGGAHFYYKHPGGRLQKGKPRPGIDRQSDGCYVVAAGSYVETEKYKGEYHQLSEGAFVDAPAWLLAQEVNTAPRQETSEAWVSRVLAEGCAKGTRNDTLAKLAGFLAGRHIPQDVAQAILVPWVLRQEGTGVTHEEASRTVQSIYAKERRSRPAANDKHYVVDEFAQDQSDRPLETMRLDEFIPRFYSERVEWLIPEWLPMRSIAFLVSPPGRFKTMLTFDAAISVAGGWPFMGQYPVQDPGPVLVIQQEDDYGDMARRFNRIFAARVPGVAGHADDGETMAAHLAVPDYPPVHVCTTRGFTLGIENLRKLEDLIRTIRPRVVVIDPLYSITSADDFMAHAARDMMPLKRLRDAYDCAFLIAAHTKKGADPGREGLWGSQFLNAFLETGWQIRDREDAESNQVQVQRHFKSSGFPPMLNLEFLLDDNEGYRIVVTDPDEDGIKHDVVLTELARALAFTEKQETGVTTAELAEKTGLNLRTVQRRCKKFRDAGLIVQTDNGNWKIPTDTTTATTPGAPDGSTPKQTPKSRGRVARRHQ